MLLPTSKKSSNTESNTTGICVFWVEVGGVYCLILDYSNSLVLKTHLEGNLFLLFFHVLPLNRDSRLLQNYQEDLEEAEQKAIKATMLNKLCETPQKAPSYGLVF